MSVVYFHTLGDSTLDNLFWMLREGDGVELGLAKKQSVEGQIIEKLKIDGGVHYNFISHAYDGFTTSSLLNGDVVGAVLFRHKDGGAYKTYLKAKANDEEELDTDECVVVRKIRDAATNGAKEQANAGEGARVAQAMDDNANRTVEADVDEADLSDDALSKKLGYNHYMIASVWRARERMLLIDCVKETRFARMALKRRKQRINKVIMAAVSANRLVPSLVLKDAKHISTAPCTKFVMGKFNRFYL